jgi:AbrB family looped-hinge helix DNA binding protein
MTSRLINVSDRGQVSIPADIRSRWQMRRLLLIDEGDHLTLRPVPDDPVTALIGKYRDLPVSSDESRSDDRDAEARHDRS